MSGRKIGYIRVSTRAQAKDGTSLESQREALEKEGCVRIFEDRGISGAKASRAGLDAMLDWAYKGDTIVVKSLSRIGRSLSNLISLTKGLDERGITLKTLDEGIDTSSSTGRLMLNIFGSLAEFERELTAERTALGREKARELGRYGGRPRKYGEKEALQLLKLRKAGFSLREVMSAMRISQGTYYRLAALPSVKEELENL